MAKVYIDIELCKSCKLCMHLCPKGVFEMTSFVNKKGYNYMSAKNEEQCIACRQCENGCPDFAIHIEK